MKSPTEIHTMKDLRVQIDRIDADLVKLFAIRQQHIDRAVQLKANENLPARIHERVQDVLNKVTSLSSKHGFSPEVAHKIWTVLIEEMIAREERAMREED